MEYRKLECTDCGHESNETGDAIQARAGDVLMRRCSVCNAPTVHVIVHKKKVKMPPQKAEVAHDE